MRETSVRATPGRNRQGQDVHDSSLYYSLLSSETKNGQREGLGSRTRIQAGTQKQATEYEEMCDFIIQIQPSEFTTPAALLFMISLVN